jgi:2,3-bisphosphoglycerate-dependent phosphoglycerate mutase
MTTIYFVRHAQSDYSVHNDKLRPLTPKGRLDSKKVTSFLNDAHINAVYSSPYQRTIDTVKNFADTAGISIQICDDFRERKIRDTWISYEDIDTFLKSQWSDFNYKFCDGESLYEVQNRNIHALNQILDKHMNENVVIATHGTALSTIINYYRHDFGFFDFMRIVNFMPFIVKMEFNGTNFQSMVEFQL